MFVLKKCITAFLVPPGLFIALLLVIAWRLRSRRQHRWALTLAGIALGLWLVSTGAVGRAMMAPLEQGLSITAHPHGDVIVLLGGGINDKVPDLSGTGTPTASSLHRVVMAARLQKRLGIPIITSGGGVFTGHSAESLISRRFLIDLGIPPDKILVEDQSRDTQENVRYTGRIMERHGFRRPLLVTSAYHMRRSVMAFRQAGIEVIPMPTQFISSREADTVWFDWLPDAGFMSDVAMALKEQIGMLYYRLAHQEGK
jgi:uncharacterized SAM-binding protein YcdF (DUF218 family)